MPKCRHTSHRKSVGNCWAYRRGAISDDSHAYAYWKAHSGQFSRNFYFRGYSGWALRLAQVAFFLAGVSGHVKRLCEAKTTEEQERIWRKHLRPVMLNSVMLKGFLGNPYVCISVHRAIEADIIQCVQLARTRRPEESDELFPARWVGGRLCQGHS